MKKKFLFVLTILTTVSFYAFSDGIGDGGREGLHVRSFASRIVIAPIETNVENDVIETYFNTDLGVVNIVVTNDRRMTFIQKNVDTAVEKTSTINVSNLPAGLYTVSYKDNSGNVIKLQSLKKD